VVEVIVVIRLKSISYYSHRIYILDDSRMLEDLIIVHYHLLPLKSKVVFFLPQPSSAPQHLVPENPDFVSV